MKRDHEGTLLCTVSQPRRRRDIQRGLGPAMSPSEEPGQIKVVRIIARLNIGGPAIQAVLLTKGLPSTSFSSILIAGVVGDMEGDMTGEAQRNGVVPVIIPELGREISWRHDLAALWKLIRILRQVKPHLVHTHTAKAGFLGRLAAWVAGVPVKVHTFHGHIFHGYFGPKRTKLFLRLERWMARMTDRLVVVSESQREELALTYKIADRSKFEVVPLGFDLRSFAEPHPRGLLRAQLGIPGDAFVVGFVGRLVPIKNPGLLLDAVELLSQRVRQVSEPESHASAVPVHLLFIGGGELESSLKVSVKERGLEKHVSFLGWRRDMAPIYTDLDLVVLTSKNEGTPVALIEAMASGKPYVATDVGGVRDLMGREKGPVSGALGGRFTRYENGILAPEGDVKTLASAVLWCLQHRDEAVKIGQAGQAFASRRFSEQRLLADMQRLYTELLAPMRGRRAAA